MYASHLLSLQDENEGKWIAYGVSVRLTGLVHDIQTNAAAGPEGARTDVSGISGADAEQLQQALKSLMDTDMEVQWLGKLICFLVPAFLRVCDEGKKWVRALMVLR